MDYRESYHTETTVDSDGKIVLSLPFQAGEKVDVVVTPREEEEKQQDRPSFFELMEKYRGIVKDMPEDLAENHDHYAHGAPKRKK